MTAAAVIKDVRAAGLELRLGKLGRLVVVGPREKKTPDLLEKIKQHKAEILESLGLIEGDDMELLTWTGAVLLRSAQHKLDPNEATYWRQVGDLGWAIIPRGETNEQR